MVQDASLSGVELLALYGEEDNELLGAFKIPKMSSRFKKIAKVASMATPYGLMYHAGKAGYKAAKKRLHGDDSRVGSDDRIGNDVYFPELLGATKKKKTTAKKKKFLPGLTKGIKKVGKVTSGFTSAAASALGVPKGLQTALSKLDPTKKRPSATAAVKALTADKEIVPVPAESMKIDTKKIAIIGGAGIGGLILLKVLLSAPRRS